MLYSLIKNKSFIFAFESLKMNSDGKENQSHQGGARREMSHKQMACGATWQECHYGVKMVYQRQPAQSGDVAFDSAAAERRSAGLDSQGC